MTPAELILRGRDAYREHVRRTRAPGAVMPWAIDGANIVTRDDFLAHADVLLTFVEESRPVRNLQILGRDGALMTLLCRNRPL